MMWRLLLAAVFFCVNAAWSEELPAVAGSHASKQCEDCHLEDEVKDCSACHDSKSNPHPVGIKLTRPAPPEMPLDKEGRLLCRTCHKLHGGDPSIQYVMRDENAFSTLRGFCSSCHLAGLASISPHDAFRGEGRCLFCHTRLPKRKGEDIPEIKGKINQLCNFCHSNTDPGHWEHVGITPPLPVKMKLGPDGKPTCATCHDPHRTAATTHRLRPSTARIIGRAQETNPHSGERTSCRSCHNKAFADEIKGPDYALLQGGNMTSLCLSCHITGQRHHPVAVTLPSKYEERIKASGMNLPLNKRKRITCYTCHDNQCSSGRYSMAIRNFSRVESDICWACHEKIEFGSIDPHTDDPKQCRWCHETRPHPGKGEIAKGLIARTNMICLLCHEAKPHPASADHLKKPSKKIIVDVSLPLSQAGTVTCSTCHEPHLKSNQLPGRLRRDPAAICHLCHFK